MRNVMLLGLVLLLSGCVRSEDLYEGKPASSWLERLKHPDASARWRAALALGQIGHTAPKRTIAALTRALTDDDSVVRWAAATSLSSFGPDAKNAVPLLSAMTLTDENPAGRAAAAEAVKSIEANKASEATAP